MAKANQPRPDKPPSALPPAPAAPSRRCLYLLLGALAVFLSAAVGRWVQQRMGPLPREVPEIRLDGADSEVADAIASARDAVRKDRESAEAWGRLAMTLHAHRHLDAAVTCYQAAEALEGDNPLWPYLEGLIRRDSAEPDTAMPRFRRAADLTQPDSLPRFALADHLLDQGRFDEAEAQYQMILKASPGECRASLALAQIAMTRDRPKDALRHAEQAADHPSSRKRVCALRVAALERLGEAPAADRERQRLAQLPEDASWPDVGLDRVSRLQVGLRARLNQATSLLQQRRVDESVAELREAVQRYPMSDQAWAALGKTLGVKKDYAGAVDAMRKSIELAKDKADHWFALGLVWQAQPDHPRAVNAFRTVIELRPTDATAYLQLGESLQALADRKGAVDALRSALRYRPDMEEARLRLAKLEGK